MTLRNAVGLAAVWIMLAATAVAQLQGRVVMSGAERSDVVVTLQTLNGQIIHQTFTSSRGNFRVEGVGVSSANPMYLVIEEEGYKPYRQRIIASDIRGSGTFTIYLEPVDDGVTRTGDSDGTLVDVGQLQVEIPAEALEEYDAAIEDSADGNYERAIERLELALEMAPEFYDAWINLGGLYDRLGRYEDAKTAYMKASETNPAGTLALRNLGAMYYQQGEREMAAENVAAFGTFSIAEEWLRKAVELNPVSPEARSFLGATLYRMTRYPEAQEMLQSAVALDENQVDARLMLINVFARQNQYPAALEQAVIFLENYPDRPERAAIERVRSQLEDALGR